MSLINQALRKAQRDRTPQTMASSDDGAALPRNPAPMPVVHPGMSPSLVIGLVVVVALLIGIVAGLSVVLLKKEPTSPQAIAATATPSEPQAQPLEPLPALKPAMSPISPILQPQTTNETTSPNVLDELRLAREAAEAQVATQTSAPETQAPPIAVETSQEVIQWLSQAKVSGVRLSPSGDKVILNGRAYSVGETVHFGLGLKVLVIQEKRILFADANGKKYMKRL